MQRRVEKEGGSGEGAVLGGGWGWDRDGMRAV